MPDGDARVWFDANGRVLLYDLYRKIPTEEHRGSGTSANVVSLRAANAERGRRGRLVALGLREGIRDRVSFELLKGRLRGMMTRDAIRFFNTSFALWRHQHALLRHVLPHSTSARLMH